MKLIAKCISLMITLFGISGFTDGLLEWYGFLSSIKENYIAVREWVFSWTPEPVSENTQNYLVVGAGISSAFVRANLSTTGTSEHAEKVGRSNFYAAQVYIFFIGVLVWPVLPIMMITILSGMLNNLWEGQRPIFGKGEEFLFSGVWFVAKELVLVLLVFVGILFFSTDLLSKLGF